jgi:hypothetical protein
MDIVKILHNLAEARQLEYHYGKKAALNLLDGTADPNKAYLLHEFTNRKSNYNQTGTRIESVAYEGKFFLVKHADYSLHMYAETGATEDGKYATGIAPLIDVFTTLGNDLACMQYTVTQWDNIDVTDALDANMDGLLCSYKILVPLVYGQ